MAMIEPRDAGRREKNQKQNWDRIEIANKILKIARRVVFDF